MSHGTSPFLLVNPNHLFGCSIALLRWSNPECQKKVQRTVGLGARTFRGGILQETTIF